MDQYSPEFQEQLDQLNRDGYILIPNALPPGRVEQWKTVLYALYDRGAYEISNGVGNGRFREVARTGTGTGRRTGRT